MQLAQEGLVPLKYETVDGALVGLDVGPSTIAVYSKQGAALAPLAPEVEQPWAQARRIQRAMDRSRRATNPQCFNADGTCKRGAKVTVRSSAYQALRKNLAETERVLQASRKRSHGALANRILACGNVLQSEKLSYTAFQKSFGRSTKVRAAGSLMSKLRRKAERAGGELRDLDTWACKLSQYDHSTNTCTKKALSERWHVLGDGSGVVQRDMYSAFLAACVTADAGRDAIHSSHAALAWPAAQSLLGRAGWMRCHLHLIMQITQHRLKESTQQIQQGFGATQYTKSCDRLEFNMKKSEWIARYVAAMKAGGSSLPDEELVARVERHLESTEQAGFLAPDSWESPEVIAEEDLANDGDR